MPEVYSQSNDGSVIMGFEWTTLKNNYASNVAGRPMFDKVLMVSLRSPGQKYSEVKYEAIREFTDGKVKKDATIFAKYGQEVQKFLDAGNDAGDLKGTPVTEVPWIDSRLAIELKLLGVHTLETMANLDDSALQKIGPGARAMQEKAKAFLKQATDTAAATRYAEENANLLRRIDDLQSQLAAVCARLEGRNDSAPVIAATAPETEPQAPAPAAPAMSAAMAATLGSFAAKADNVIPDETPKARPGKKRGRKSNAEKAQALSDKAA